MPQRKQAGWFRTTAFLHVNSHLFVKSIRSRTFYSATPTFLYPNIIILRRWYRVTLKKLPPKFRCDNYNVRARAILYPTTDQKVFFGQTGYNRASVWMVSRPVLVFHRARDDIAEGVYAYPSGMRSSPDSKRHCASNEAKGPAVGPIARSRLPQW